MTSGAGIAPDRQTRLPRLVLMAMVVGAFGGFGAWLFRAMIAVVHNLAFEGKLSDQYSALVHTPPSPWGAGIILVPMLGALIVVFLVSRFAPEARGHGVPEVMEAIHYRKGVIRSVVVVVKAAASAVSIGTGGSVGREGPIVQIGSAFGSAFSLRVRAGLADRQILIAAGAAAGIAATFDAPLGGVLFAVELLLITISARTVLAVAASVASGMAVSRALLGGALAFDVTALQQVVPSNLDWMSAGGLVVVGVIMGLASIVFIRSIYGFEDFFERWFVNPYLRHLVGMGVVGAMMYGFLLWRGQYVVEGLGYATVRDILVSVVTNPAVLLLFAAAKLIATSLTLGSGASGGVFSPAIFVGAALGSMFGSLLTMLGIPVDPTVFALAGVAGMIAGSTGAVMTGIVMTSELTGDFAVIVPLLIAAAIATAVRKRLSPASVYTEKLFRRGHWVPEGLEAAGLRSTRARDLAEALPDDGTTLPSVNVDAEASLTDLFQRLEEGKGSVTVVEAGGRAMGVIHQAHLSESLAGRRRHPPD